MRCKKPFSLGRNQNGLCLMPQGSVRHTRCDKSVPTVTRFSVREQVKTLLRRTTVAFRAERLVKIKDHTASTLLVPQRRRGFTRQFLKASARGVFGQNAGDRRLIWLLRLVLSPLQTRQYSTADVEATDYHAVSSDATRLAVLISRLARHHLVEMFQ